TNWSQEDRINLLQSVPNLFGREWSEVLDATLELMMKENQSEDGSAFVVQMASKIHYPSCYSTNLQKSSFTSTHMFFQLLLHRNPAVRAHFTRALKDSLTTVGTLFCCCCCCCLFGDINWLATQHCNEEVYFLSCSVDLLLDLLDTHSPLRFSATHAAQVQPIAFAEDWKKMDLEKVKELEEIVAMERHMLTQQSKLTVNDIMKPLVAWCYLSPAVARNVWYQIVKPLYYKYKNVMDSWENEYQQRQQSQENEKKYGGTVNEQDRVNRSKPFRNIAETFHNLSLDPSWLAIFFGNGNKNASLSNKHGPTSTGTGTGIGTAATTTTPPIMLPSLVNSNKHNVRQWFQLACRDLMRGFGICHDGVLKLDQYDIVIRFAEEFGCVFEGIDLINKWIHYEVMLHPRDNPKARKHVLKDRRAQVEIGEFTRGGDLLVDLYQQTGCHDLAYAFWKKRCTNLGTMSALTYEQYGQYGKAQKCYDKLQAKYFKSQNTEIIAESEVTLWQRHYVECCRKLNQWDWLDDFSREQLIPELFLESQCHQSNNDTMTMTMAMAKMRMHADI
ncbi:hypothetical protein RFI_26090, partial [Reticulomyxa filosa]